MPAQLEKKSVIVPDMGRRRGQRKGHLRLKNGSWLLEWREYHTAADGSSYPVRLSRVLCPEVDPETGRRVTKKQAQRLAWELVLSKLEQTTLHAETLLTLEQFWTQRFYPEWVWSLKPAGKKHYVYIWRHLQPLYRRRLREIRTPDIQQLCINLIDRGLSVQTARHVRNAVSAIFRHAKAAGCYHEENPARMVRLPEMRRRPRHALTPAQAAAVLNAPSFSARDRAAAYIAMCTSLNVAELAGLKWKYCNLDAAPRLVESELIPPYTIAVRAHLYRGHFGTTKTPSRRRNVPLPAPARAMLAALIPAAGADPEAWVFAGPQGAPLNELHVARRVWRPLGKALGLPFSLSWHVFRHTAATLAEQVGMALSDRRALMGHADEEMTMHYTHADPERLRESVEKISDLILVPAAPSAADLERLFNLGDPPEEE